MTNAEFREWLKSMGFSQAKAADALGLGESTVNGYATGKRRGDGGAVEIPLHIALACSALYHRIGPWRPG